MGVGGRGCGFLHIVQLMDFFTTLPRVLLSLIFAEKKRDEKQPALKLGHNILEKNKLSISNAQESVATFKDQTANKVVL
jgi:hypothetical protein